MTPDISNLDQPVCFAQYSPDSYIGRSASPEVAMIAVIPKFAVIGPVSLNRTGELHLG
jgi:hypothetical protein